MRHSQSIRSPRLNAASLKKAALAWIDSMSRLRDTCRFYFAGSVGSARVIRELRDAADAYRTGGYSIVRSTMFVLRLLKIAPPRTGSQPNGGCDRAGGFPCISAGLYECDDRGGGRREHIAEVA